MCSGLPGKLLLGYDTMEHHLSVFCYMLQGGIGAFHPTLRCEEHFASIEKIGISWAAKCKKNHHVFIRSCFKIQQGGINK